MAARNNLHGLRMRPPPPHLHPRFMRQQCCMPSQEHRFRQRIGKGIPRRHHDLSNSLCPLIGANPEVANCTSRAERRWLAAQKYGKREPNEIRLDESDKELFRRAQHLVDWHATESSADLAQVVSCSPMHCSVAESSAGQASGRWLSSSTPSTRLRGRFARGTGSSNCPPAQGCSCRCGPSSSCLEC